jgi:hypothetical protein
MSIEKNEENYVDEDLYIYDVISNSKEYQSN